MASTYGAARRLTDSSPAAVTSVGNTIGTASTGVERADQSVVADERGAGADGLHRRGQEVNDDLEFTTADTDGGSSAIQWYGSALDGSRTQAHQGVVTYEQGTEWREDLNAWARQNPRVSLTALADYNAKQQSAGQLQVDGLNQASNAVKNNQRDTQTFVDGLKSGSGYTLAQNQSQTTQPSGLTISVSDQDMTKSLNHVFNSLKDPVAVANAARLSRGFEIAIREQNLGYANFQNSIYFTDFVDQAQDRSLKLDRTGLDLAEELSRQGRQETQLNGELNRQTGLSAAEVSRRRSQFTQDQDALNALLRTDADLQAAKSRANADYDAHTQLRFEQENLRKDTNRYIEYQERADALADRSPEDKAVWEDFNRLTAQAANNDLGMNTLVETIESRYPHLDTDHDPDLSGKAKDIIRQRFGLPPDPSDLSGEIGAQEQRVAESGAALDRSLETLDGITVPEYENPLTQYEQEHRSKEPYPTLKEMDFGAVRDKINTDIWWSRAAEAGEIGVQDYLRDDGSNSGDGGGRDPQDPNQTPGPGAGGGENNPNATDDNGRILDIEAYWGANGEIEWEAGGGTHDVDPDDPDATDFWGRLANPDLHLQTRGEVGWKAGGGISLEIGGGGDDGTGGSPSGPGDGGGQGGDGSDGDDSGGGGDGTLPDGIVDNLKDELGVRGIAFNTQYGIQIENVDHKLIPDNVENNRALANNAKESYDFRQLALESNAQQADLTNQTNREQTQASIDQTYGTEVRNTQDAIRLTEERAAAAAENQRLVTEYSASLGEYTQNRNLQDFRADSTDNLEWGMVSNVATNADNLLTPDQASEVHRILDDTSDISASGQLWVLEERLGPKLFDALITGRSSY